MKSALLGASLALLSVASLNAFADEIEYKGILSVPSTFTYGNDISNTSPASVTYGGNTYFGTSFYDDYQFTVAPGFANSLTSTINFGNFFGISGLQARLYTGHTHQTGTVVPGTLIQAWGNTMNAGSFDVTNVVLGPVAILNAGNYTLQIRGVATGLAGGTYSGVFQITAIPEADTYAMLIAGLGVMGFVARRKANKV